MKQHYFSRDTKEFLYLLHQYGVEYVIVGGEAVIFYGHARLTGDLDIFYNPSLENRKRLYNALLQFWEGDIPGIREPDDLSEDTVVQFGVPPNRIDLIGSIEDVAFEEAWATRVKDVLRWRGKKFPIYYIELDLLISNKKAVGRPRDQEDIKYLLEAKRRRK